MVTSETTVELTYGLIFSECNMNMPIKSIKGATNSHLDQQILTPENLF